MSENGERYVCDVVFDLVTEGSPGFLDAARRAAGHGNDCRGQTRYDDGFNTAMRSQGHPVSPPYTCTCGKDKK